MSLQGTLDTFALADVIRLLAATSKTGHLRITSTRGAGGVWLDAGHVVGIESPLGGEAPETRAFELLRLEEGSFAFEAGEQPTEPEEPTEVENLLAGAEALLDEWRAIVAVVPSLEHRVALTRTLPAESVPVSQQQWVGLVAIGGGMSVRAMGDVLNQDELAVSRTVQALVEAGLVAVREPSTVGPDTELHQWSAEDDDLTFGTEDGADGALATEVDEPATTEDTDELPWVRDAARVGDDVDEFDEYVDDVDELDEVDEDVDVITGTYGPVAPAEVEDEAAAEAPAEVAQGPRPTWASLYPQHAPARPPAPATLAEALSLGDELPIPEDPALLQHLAGLRVAGQEDDERSDAGPADPATGAAGADASLEGAAQPDRGRDPQPTPIDPANRGALLKFLSSVRT